MARRNIIVDDELLENARRVIGERTYSATVTKGLEELLRQARFRDLLTDWEALAAEKPIFREGYLDEIGTDERKRVSADEKRAPVKKRARGTR